MNAAAKPTRSKPRIYYQIEIWRGPERVEIVAMTSRRSIALAAYEAACRIHLAPGCQLILFQAGVVMASHEMPANDNTPER